MPTLTNCVFPESALCLRCTNLKLTAADFYVSEDDINKTPDPTNLHDPITIDTRDWEDTQIFQSCSLCRMIKSAVETSRFEWQSSEPPNSCDIKRTRLHGSHSGNDLKYDVRYLEIVANYDWTSSHGISLLPVEFDKYPGCFPGRTLDPQGIDTERIQGWINQCQGTHGIRCQHVETSQFQAIRGEILVVDIDDLSLVLLPADARYIALSYVWGNVTQPMATKNKLELFKAKNGLISVYQQLPRVILDAMRFIKSLGERYLWVDTLCIIQDYAESKERLINSMHTIYENAYLTLFAVTGVDSNAGLPGVRPTPRGTSQLVTKLSDGMKLIFPMNYQHLKRSEWASRAWTYQEYFFANRRLLFLGGQVVYQCSAIRWREDITQEHFERGVMQYQDDGLGSRMDWEPPNFFKFNDPSNAWDRYLFNRYVDTYLDRKLTFDSDILSAFAGIINEAGNKMLKIHWGLTQENFGLDMLWMPCKWLVRRPGFPSWSWAGWKGPVTYYDKDDISGHIWLHYKSWIDWYTFQKANNAFHLLSSGYSPHREAAITQEIELEEQELRRDRANGKIADDQDESECDPRQGGVLTSLLWRFCQSNNVIAPNERKSPYPLHYTLSINEQTLLFRTITAYVSISSLNPDGEMSSPPRDDQRQLPSAPTLHIYTLDNTYIGTAWPHAQELFEKIASRDRDVIAVNSRASSLKIEIAFIAGPVDGDWRPRSENCSTVEYLIELTKSDLNLNQGMLEARYQRRLDYERTIEKLYFDLVYEEHGTEDDIEVLESRLTAAFWTSFELQISLMHLKERYPGHCEESLRPIINRLKARGTRPKIRKGQKFMKVMLIGDLGDGGRNGSECIKERVGMGEIQEEAMGLLQGLAVRDVMLN